MANVQATFGFRYAGLIDGAAPTFGVMTGQISSTTTASIFTGDPLTPVGGGASAGFFTVSSAASGSGSGVGGVALSFSWLSKIAGTRIWRPYWLGLTTDVAAGNVQVKFVNHPQAVFEVACKTGPLVQSNIGQNFNFATGTGNSFSGISGFVLDDTTGSNNTNLPFRLYEVPGITPDPAIPPYDPTSTFNQVKVIFQNLVQY